MNLRLRPKLLSDLKPGTRIVSHNYDMGDWVPEKTKRMEVQGTSGPFRRTAPRADFSVLTDRRPVVSGPAADPGASRAAWRVPPES